MSKVITVITIETEVYDKKDLNDENISRYKNNIVKTLEKEVDDNAKITVEIRKEIS